MTDLADFLLARIAEDEDTANTAAASPWQIGCSASDEWDDEDRDDHFGRDGSHQDECTIDAPNMRIYDEGGHDRPDALHIVRWQPARVLAECEAKRRIVNRYLTIASADRFPGVDYTALNADLRATEWAVVALALPFADHPDFRDEWRPSSG